MNNVKIIKMIMIITIITTEIRIKQCHVHETCKKYSLRSYEISKKYIYNI